MKDAVFCFCCKLFCFNPKSMLALGGLADWKHLTERLNKHERSTLHIDCFHQWQELIKRKEQSKGIDIFNQELYHKEKQRWRNVLERIIAIIIHLAEHNLSFRGSSDTLHTPNNGNFLGQVELLARFDPVMQDHVKRCEKSRKNDHYLGHRIQNDIIQTIALEIKNCIRKRVLNAKYYSILLDCTTDVSHTEQMSVIIRIVHVDNRNVEIKEHFLNFVEVCDTAGKGLSDVILSELKSLGLSLKHCRGQGYDNGSNMRGQQQGVQAHILRENPRAFYTPCGAHNLNLLLSDMCNSCPKAMSFFGVIQRLYSLFAASTHRWHILKKHVDLSLKPLSETRWECRLESVKAVRFQMKGIGNALCEIAEVSKDPKIKSEANSLASKELNRFEFLLSTVIWYSILLEVNRVSKTLQSSQIPLDVAVSHLSGLESFLNDYRQNGFDTAIKEAAELAKDLSVAAEFSVKRFTKKRKLFDYEGDDETSNNPKEMFKTDYFLIIIDKALNSLARRFELYKNHTAKFGILYNISKLKTFNKSDLMQACNQIQESLSDGSDFDVDGKELFEELQGLSRIVFHENCTALEVLKYLCANRLEEIYPNVAVALRIALTIPVTVATAERSFSKLKLIKTFLRSTISQERLSGLAIISIEKDIIKIIDKSDIIEKFAAMKARKIVI